LTADRLSLDKGETNISINFLFLKNDPEKEIKKSEQRIISKKKKQMKLVNR
jgi:hypothetical protein